MINITETNRLIKPPAYLRDAAHIQNYESTYARSIENPDAFWDEIASGFIWENKWTKVCEVQPPYHRWFVGGTTNITLNMLDRHIVGHRRNKVALLWASENGREVVVTYDRLLRRVCQLANALTMSGVRKGDTVLIYMPNTVEFVYAMLACARIGAIHASVHTGLGVQALRERIESVRPKVVFCADATLSGGKVIALKPMLDDALQGNDCVEKIVVLRRQEPKIELYSGLEVDFYDFLIGMPQWINPEIVESSHPLFVYFTTDAAGAPKGIVQAQGGYMVGSAYYTRIFFDLQDSDILWNTSDLSWITGHTNGIYGPLLNGATLYFREGALTTPNTEATWAAIERHGINILSTMPTTLRILKSFGAAFSEKYDLSTLRLVASTGEPLPAELYSWASEFVAGRNGFVANSWWEAELGAPMLGTLMANEAKLNFVGKPFPGVALEVVQTDGSSAAPNQPGKLAILRPVPTMLSETWQNQEQYSAYWSQIPGRFATGDDALKDEDGFFAILGRHDDALIIGGFRIGVHEIEQTLAKHPAVKEAAIFGVPDSVTGTKLKAWVVLHQETSAPERTRSMLYGYIFHELGRMAVPGEIVFCDALPQLGDGSRALQHPR
ncbi:AMP-dependent synthetase and ligase [Chloroherpeton thalassium ATCC 35110]|uniref:acetate--CoA ligase n=1 Tax=Chloroherpeton thalassium (strain ATCC 35110 / GB-78) TaxID=517418 RepID=B3QUM6_CHLT3|nr:AMP-binding protein [Chloroherpeton thalassium]ACF12932.1 AMP-dependent synthetase and ligase [Chloroherpeton thalassium ATCC 35110]